MSIGLEPLGQTMTRSAADNPLLSPWTGPFEAPPFAEIDVADFRPAFDAALAENVAEIDAIADAVSAPSFENTIAAMERAGAKLDKVCAVFFNLASADTSDALQEIEMAMAPILSRHSSAIYLNEALFRRIDTLWTRRETLGLDAEQARVLQRYHTIFSRAGGGLPQAAKTRLAAIGERLATLGTQFGQNLLADEKAYELVLDGEADLAGLPRSLDRRGGGDRRGARPCRPACDHPVALVDRAVPAILDAARPARAGVPGLGQARREWRQDRQSRHRRRDRRAAGRKGRACSATRISPPFASPIPWRRRPRNCPRAAARGVGAGQGARRARGARAAGARRRTKVAISPSNLGIGVICRRSAARPSSTSTRRRSSRISSSTG